MIYLYAVVFCSVVNRAPASANIKVVQVIQNIEHAEGEIFGIDTPGILSFGYNDLVNFKVTMHIVSVASLIYYCFYWYHTYAHLFIILQKTCTC